MMKAGKRTTKKKVTKKASTSKKRVTKKKVAAKKVRKKRKATKRKTPKKVAGRIAWLDRWPDRRAMLVQKVREGAKPPSSACAFVDIDRQRFHEWLQKGRADKADGLTTTYSRFADEITVAEEAAFDEIHAIVRQGILGHEEKVSITETVTETSAADIKRGIPASTSTKEKVSVHSRFRTEPKLGLAYMQAMRPQEWGPKQEVKHVGEISIKRIIIEGVDPATVLPAQPMGDGAEAEGEGEGGEIQE